MHEPSTVLLPAAGSLGTDTSAIPPGLHVGECDEPRGSVLSILRGSCRVRGSLALLFQDFSPSEDHRLPEKPSHGLPVSSGEGMAARVATSGALTAGSRLGPGCAQWGETGPWLKLSSHSFGGPC